MSEVPPPSSPYKGLAAFEDSAVDALFFFGRDRDSQVIAANLMASRLTVLFGPTGVGKTSVLRAGVAYKLRKEAGVDVRVHSSWIGHPGGAFADLAPQPGRDVYLMLDQFEEFFLYHEGDRTHQTSATPATLGVVQGTLGRVPVPPGRDGVREHIVVNLIPSACVLGVR